MNIKLTEQELEKVYKIQNMCVKHSNESNDDVFVRFSPQTAGLSVDCYKGGWVNKEYDVNDRIKREHDKYDYEVYEWVDEDGKKHISHEFVMYMDTVKNLYDLGESLDKLIVELETIFNS